RDPITAFGKDRHAVNHKGEALAGLVALLPEFQTTQARALRCFIHELAIDQQSSFESVERMGPESIGPPKSRVRNSEVKRNPISTRRQTNAALRGQGLVGQIVYDDGCIGCGARNNFNLSSQV